MPTLAFLWLLAACAAPVGPPRWQLSSPLQDSNVFGPAIRAWQSAQSWEELGGRLADAHDGELGQALARFERELRAETARRVLEWVAREGKARFVPDGEIDHWPTFREVLRRGVDDCDGLELLTFRLLRRAGFQRGEIYRAVLVERDTGDHHMVTLWFADGIDEDPIVLDPLRQAVSLPTPLSRIEAWQPVLMFDEHDAFEPRGRP